MRSVTAISLLAFANAAPHMVKREYLTTTCTEEDALPAIETTTEAYVAMTTTEAYVVMTTTELALPVAETTTEAYIVMTTTEVALPAGETPCTEIPTESALPIPDVPVPEETAAPVADAYEATEPIGAEPSGEAYTPEPSSPISDDVLPVGEEPEASGLPDYESNLPGGGFGEDVLASSAFATKSSIFGMIVAALVL